MDCNYLKDADVDKMQAILTAFGFNLRKFLRAFVWHLFKELERFSLSLVPFGFPLGAQGQQLAPPGLNLEF